MTENKNLQKKGTDTGIRAKVYSYKKGVNYYIHLKTSVFHPCYSGIKSQ
ncbi:hypothetical protein B425_3596 [Bacillus amyloliquefaciens]|nr:hypothetical protein B425_3596 [Bacillus amyloliquefaciens]